MMGILMNNGTKNETTNKSANEATNEIANETTSSTKFGRVRKTKIRVLCIPVILILALMLSACSQRVMWAGNSYPGNMEATYKLFNGDETQAFYLNAGDKVTFTYSSSVQKGSLAMSVTDPDNKSVLELKANESGTAELAAKAGGKYRLTITGADTSGNYDIKWKINK